MILSVISYVNNKKGKNMIKATSINETKRNAFAKANAKRIARGTTSTKRTIRGLVLDNYKLLATGTCSTIKLNKELNNVFIFNKQKEVA